MKKVGVLAFSFCALFLVSCTTTFTRAMVRRDASVDDYLYFPERKIAKAEVPHEIKREIDGGLTAVLEDLFDAGNFSDFMAKTQTQAFLIIKDNSLVFEAYGKGCGRESIVTSFSVAKSFDSAMIGKLIEEKKILGVNQSITDFIPELLERDTRFSKIRICDLLGMTSGINYSKKSHDDTKTYFDPNLRNLAINGTRIQTEPDEVFLYNNYNPLLLGIIIERAARKSVSSYMEEKIWKSMGAEYDAGWSLDSKEDGFEKMESGINARAIDFARFGCLFRDMGIVDGIQVISKEWILESLFDHHKGNPNFYADEFGKKIKNAEKGGYYGYFWYGLYREDFSRDDFFAAGNKSQIIYVCPKSNTVIVRFGRKDGIDFWKWISAFYDLAGRL